MMYFMVFVNGLLLGILLRPIKDKIITKSRRNDTMLSTANSVADMQIKRPISTMISYNSIWKNRV
jgi:hypothetical protein